jgi:hypothetical protein
MLDSMADKAQTLSGSVGLTRCFWSGPASSIIGFCRLSELRNFDELCPGECNHTTPMLVVQMEVAKAGRGRISCHGTEKGGGGESFLRKWN